MVKFLTLVVHTCCTFSGELINTQLVAPFREAGFANLFVADSRLQGAAQCRAALLSLALVVDSLLALLLSLLCTAGRSCACTLACARARAANKQPDSGCSGSAE